MEKSPENPVKQVEKSESVPFYVNGELQPEILKQVVQKIEDIKKEGTAFSVITSNNTSGFQIFDIGERFTSVLHNGLLSTKWAHAVHGFQFKRNESDIQIDESMGGREGLDKFRENKKDNLPNTVFFNIVGRGAKVQISLEIDPRTRRPNPNEYKDIPLNDTYEKSAWIIDPYNPTRAEKEPYTLTVIFDLNKYKSECEDFIKNVKNLSKEDPAYDATHQKPSKYRAFTYNSSPKQIENIASSVPLTLDGLPKTDVSYGFTVLNRVPPKFFKGLVLHTLDDVDKQEQNINLVVKKMIEEYSSKPELILPIYDVKGNLLWPEKLTHDQILESAKK